MMAEEIKGKGWRSFSKKYEAGEITNGTDIKVYSSSGGSSTYYKVARGGKLRFIGTETSSPESVIGENDWEVKYEGEL